jgi:hypothetical protein
MSKQTSNNLSGFWKIFLLLIIVGAAALMISPVSAEKPYVTVVAVGSQSYYMGEKVIFSGTNTASNSTYLFITGPNLPEGGGSLSATQQLPVSGDPSSFAVAETKPDTTWEYTWYTSDLRLDAGTYTIYAVSTPETKDQFNNVTTYGTVSIIYKKPFITTEISPSSISPGQSFTVSGVAEGIPPDVQVWILGENYYSKSVVPVNSDASYQFVMPGEVTSKLAGGQYFVIVQHPMKDNKFNIDVSGDYVKLNNDSSLFKITGPGNLQGSNAADALIAAISGHEAHDDTYTNDTYTIVPFQITAPVSAGAGVTIAAQGDQSYYLGENMVLSGQNFDSDTTYLFITGPGTFKNGPGIPTGGGKLTSPMQNAVSGNPDSFTIVKTKPDKTWEYVYYTANLPVDAGTYTIYAVSQPKTKDQLSPDAANVGIILKKPFITAEISPATISKGVPFTVSGVAEGNPSAVQIWILGKNYYSKAIQSVNPDASYKYVVPQEVTSHLESGQYVVIVQHPMENNTFDIDVSGDYVRSLYLNNGTNLFRISGPGSLNGNDTEEALVAAFSDPRNGDDTYTEIPFLVEDTGISTHQAQSATPSPVQNPIQPVLLPFALIGAIVLVLGIVMWSKR